ncbi:MAG: hypothetical protein ACRCY3_11295 [Sphingorhabdus sp.]
MAIAPAMKILCLIVGFLGLGCAAPLFANPELDLADRGTVPSCSITDALTPAMAKQALALGFSAEQLIPSTATRPQFGGRMRCAKTLDNKIKGIGIALVEDFTLEGGKIRALYQGDTVVFSLAGTTPTATYPTRKGEFRCYRGGAAAVMQCTTGFGVKGASLLTLQNQAEEYLLGLSISAYDWPDAPGMPVAPVTLRAGLREPVTAGWINQSLADSSDAAAWTAIFEGREFTDTLLKQEGTVPISIETRLAGNRPVSETFDFAEMIALYKAMAALTREMPIR